MAIYVLIGGLCLFLLGLGTWTYGLTWDLRDVDIGQSAIAFGLAILGSIALIALFLWLGHKNRQRRD